MAKIFKEAERVTPPVPTDPAPTPAPKTADDWRDDFDAAPHDMAILVTPDGERRVEAQWRKTRAYLAEENRWGDTGYWADPIMRRRLPFEPLGWMLAPQQSKAPSSVA